MKIQLKRSVLLDGGGAKEPTVDNMEYGELAVNYNSSDPSIFIKASDGAGNDSIVKVAGIGAAGLDGYYLPLSGGTLSGNLSVGGNVSIKTDGTVEGVAFVGTSFTGAHIGDGSGLTKPAYSKRHTRSAISY